LSFVSASPGCSSAAGTVTCDVGALPAAATATLTITTAATSDSAGQTLTNTATAASSTPDPDGSDNQAAATVSVTSPPASAPTPPPATPATTPPSTPAPGRPDLVAGKTVGAPTLAVGHDVGFTLSVANVGTAPATGVAVTDPLPPGLAVAAVPSGCTTAVATVTCVVGTLPAGSSRSFDLVVRPTASIAGKTITNVATVSGDEPDPTPANDAAEATITVEPLADLDLTATVSPDPPVAGERATYTATVDNKGPSDATGVDLTAALPAGLSDVSARTGEGRCVVTAGRVTCELGELPSGGDVQITITGRVDGTLARRTLTSRMKVRSSQLDSDLANDAVTLSERVARSAPTVDLSVAIRVRERHVRTDGLLHYTITAANLSDTPATGVRVTGTLDAPVRLVALLAGAARRETTAAAGGCEHALPLVCSLGGLAPHTRVTIQLTVRPLLARALVGTVSIRSNESESTYANNSNDVRITVAAAVASVTVLKTVREHKVTAGSRVHYTIAVTPLGTVAALGVRVCDRLPRDQVYAAVDGAAYVNGQACWTIARLAAGSTRRFTVTTIADRTSATHRSVNTVRVTGANFRTRSAAARLLVVGVRGRPGGAGG
jgi:uncharacterized repeat protein (TIGR01451 family)